MRPRGRSRRRAALSAFGGVAALLAAQSAAALQPGSIDNTPVQLSITDAASVLYNFDNRNFQWPKVNTATDDKWGMFYNRLNLQASWKHWRVGLRLDAVYFYTHVSADQVAQRMVDNQPPPLPGEVRTKTDEENYRNQERIAAANDLATRFQSTVYPAKYYVGYDTPDLHATLGDFYAQFGRGLVLSVRKFDELSSDTTVRGARVEAHFDATDDVHLKLTALGGAMNPLRVDEASGRILQVAPSRAVPATPGVSKFTEESGDRDFVDIAEAGMPRTSDDVSAGYATDQLAGGQVEADVPGFQLATQGAVLERHAPSIGTFTSTNVQNLSQSFAIPDFDGHGAAYVEVAYQHRSTPDDQPVTDPGSAVYGSLSFIQKPVTLLVEVKNYRRFFPLTANIDLNQANEFQQDQYSTPPTTESIWTDTEFNYENACVTGGRVRADVAVSDNDTLYAWVGRYNSWAEAAAVNFQCDTSNANLNRIWDVAVGLQKTAHHRRSRADIVVGARDDETAEPFIDANNLSTDVFYRENYLRFDIIEWITGPFSLQLQGWHRHRIEPKVYGEAWFEGEQLVGFQWAPHWVFAGGIEYDTKTNDPDLYLNGLVRYNVTSATSLQFFIGQRRGSLRCVSGVCRVFPPFEGAQLDATIRL
jgi:Family of unknown function (DUF6029)